MNKEEKLKKIQDLIELQADDEILWDDFETIEDLTMQNLYLKWSLRLLYAAIYYIKQNDISKIDMYIQWQKNSFDKHLKNKSG